MRSPDLLWFCKDNVMFVEHAGQSIRRIPSSKMRLLTRKAWYGLTLSSIKMKSIVGLIAVGEPLVCHHGLPVIRVHRFSFINHEESPPALPWHGGELDDMAAASSKFGLCNRCIIAPPPTPQIEVRPVIGDGSIRATLPLLYSPGKRELAYNFSSPYLPPEGTSLLLKNKSISSNLMR
ncbi:hypothetical protein AVEN_78419-1 [Araneus ventricosus]|uniref:Uncharacterized protein n=1 Tax=Araneus ventricosus TaxID=182803 RepID=A0A4Y2MSJ4_ARAVE|nr:hypothetical protein AVEN_267355-1 [Araneus ventricosus]GBN29671.1 hypothetical protein AVEN_17249-1 [Araneus ventricosus]GBN29673.1 hypothetical protein AVEN_18905-1 [Araneus ventricosus]GBN29747.1 hypothetical protein AVEN_78419-1 [Araneus ventricosus]